MNAYIYILFSALGILSKKLHGNLCDYTDNYLITGTINQWFLWEDSTDQLHLH